MRRLASKLAHPVGGNFRHSSFVAGLFNFKVVPGELFPYPSHKLEGEESENLQTLIEQVRNNDKELNTAGARIAFEYGGLGLGHTAHALMCEELGTSAESRHLSTIQHSSMATYLLSTVGSKETKGKYLTGMSDGSIMMGWAVQEDCGTDISMNTAKAAMEEGTYKLTGAKRCVYASNATHFLVLAKTKTQASTENGPTEVERNTFFVVSRKADGVKVDGDMVTFTNSPAEDIVGVVGEGFKDYMITVFTEQYVYGAALLGTLKRVVQELRDGAPDKWATNTIASCACIMYAMESVLYAVTANLDRPTEDSLLEAALANAFIQSGTNEWLSLFSTAVPTTETLDKCFITARQLLSLMEPVDFLNSTAVCCGTEDYALFFQKASTLQITQLRSARSLGAKDHLPVREVDCSKLDTAIVSFGYAVEASFVRNTSRLPSQQLLINRLGECAALLYAASAAASRASSCSNKRLPTAKTEKQLATIFVNAAAQRVTMLANECRNNGLTADGSYKRISLELCEDALQ